MIGQDRSRAISGVVGKISPKMGQLIIENK